MTALHYKDICLIPGYSKLSTRKDAEVDVDFCDWNFKIPVIPSPMTCVINEEKARWFAKNGYFYIMHRFGIDNYEFVKSMQGYDPVSISVGVKQHDKDMLMRLCDENFNVAFITIDIAQGHSKLMEEMVVFMKNLGIQSNIIAGNVATPNGYMFLSQLGVDAARVGIGGGSPCSTKNKTGFTCPMYSCIKNIKDLVPTPIPIIADGGVREHSDIVKAIHAGADMVMVGGLFSKLIDSPAEVVDGHKVYYGSASQYNKGEYRNVEGIKRTLPLEPMTYREKLLEIEEDLQSAVSYAGGEHIYDVRKVKSLQVTHWEV